MESRTLRMAAMTLPRSIVLIREVLTTVAGREEHTLFMSPMIALTDMIHRGLPIASARALVKLSKGSSQVFCLHRPRGARHET